MEITLKEIAVRDLVASYVDNDDEGVWGYGGRLNIRPQYQREFVYKEKQRNAVIDTVLRGFPLNVMYWSVNDDGTYEIIDGQQRTISICQYAMGDFSIQVDGDTLAFHNLRDDQRKRMLDYKLMVYFCRGTDTEKLKWFQTINIAGEELTAQELRNAVYCGPWVTDAKRYFSRNQCAAFGLGSDYMTGTPIRQDYLETAIAWLSAAEQPDVKDHDQRIKQYMSAHQHDATAIQLWNYYQSAISWVKATFPKKRTRFMKGVEWGLLYNDHKDTVHDPAALEAEVARLILDDDVTAKKGIYPYVLTRKEKYLSIRAFSDAQRQAAYERQAGICAVCGQHFELSQMEADHITPWHADGKTTADNCQMLCRECNRRKSGK